MREKEEPLLRQLPHLPDLQSAWLILNLCCSARANHLLRALPPSLSRAYSVAHDEAMWETCKQLVALGAERSTEHDVARAVAGLQGREGGLGLRCAERQR
eukprot:6013763-Karenia_brevis.AAC.1